MAREDERIPIRRNTNVGGDRFVSELWNSTSRFVQGKPRGVGYTDTPDFQLRDRTFYDRPEGGQGVQDLGPVGLPSPYEISELQDRGIIPQGDTGFGSATPAPAPAPVPQEAIPPAPPPPPGGGTISDRVRQIRQPIDQNYNARTTGVELPQLQGFSDIVDMKAAEQSFRGSDNMAGQNPQNIPFGDVRGMSTPNGTYAMPPGTGPHTPLEGQLPGGPAPRTPYSIADSGPEEMLRSGASIPKSPDMTPLEHAEAQYKLAQIINNVKNRRDGISNKPPETRFVGGQNPYFRGYPGGQEIKEFGAQGRRNARQQRAEQRRIDKNTTMQERVEAARQQGENYRADVAAETARQGQSTVADTEKSRLEVAREQIGVDLQKALNRDATAIEINRVNNLGEDKRAAMGVQAQKMVAQSDMYADVFKSISARMASDFSNILEYNAIMDSASRDEKQKAAIRARREALDKKLEKTKNKAARENLVAEYIEEMYQYMTPQQTLAGAANVNNIPI